MDHYYAVRPDSTVDPSLNEKHIRIERAPNAELAIRMAFGRGTRRFQYKDLGAKNPMYLSDKKRIALLRSPDGWETLVDA